MSIRKLARSLLVLAPVAICAVGCTASTDDAEHSESESAALGTKPVPINPKPTPPAPPSRPALYFLAASPSSVSVNWVSPDATMDQFIVYKRDASWAWHAVHTEPNVENKNYTWSDVDHSVSAQCYRVDAASSSTGEVTSTAETCTVRPDPSVFPQSAPAAALQWSGLSSQNDGLGQLFDGNSFLAYQSRTYGVSLGLPDASGDNVKAERQGDGSTFPLMIGEAIAIRVWGAGWLTHANQTWGVDIGLSDTPVYEWYVVDAGAAGQPLGGSTYALWNKSASDFLVPSGQTYGVHLNWYQKSLPPVVGAPTPTPSGVSKVVVSDCTSDEIPLEMWVEDLTAGTGFVDHGELGMEWTSNGCPTTGAPWTFVPTAGHNYVLRAVDFTDEGCDATPNISECIRLTSNFTGNPAGPTENAVVD